MKKKLGLRDSFLFVILGLLIVVLVLICVFRAGQIDKEDALDVRFSHDPVVKISNQISLTDAVGKNISIQSYKDGVVGYVDFEVNSKVSKTVSYEVYLTKENLSLEVPAKFVKVYLTNQNDELLSNDDSKILTYYDLRLSSVDAGGKLLYSGKLAGEKQQKFRLRMWVADTYELTNESRKFISKINVKVK